jgi:hypothetical protein
VIHFEQQVPVYLEFRAMSAPVSISVPGYVLRYLDMYAERKFASDGAVVYSHPSAPANLPELRVIPLRRTVRMTA